MLSSYSNSPAYAQMADYQSYCVTIVSIIKRDVYNEEWCNFYLPTILQRSVRQKTPFANLDSVRSFSIGASKWSFILPVLLRCSTAFNETFLRRSKINIISKICTMYIKYEERVCFKSCKHLPRVRIVECYEEKKKTEQ